MKNEIKNQLAAAIIEAANDIESARLSGADIGPTIELLRNTIAAEEIRLLRQMDFYVQMGADGSDRPEVAEFFDWIQQDKKRSKKSQELP